VLIHKRPVPLAVPLHGINRARAPQPPPTSMLRSRPCGARQTRRPHMQATPNARHSALCRPRCGCCRKLHLMHPPTGGRCAAHFLSRSTRLCLASPAAQPSRAAHLHADGQAEGGAVARHIGGGHGGQRALRVRRAVRAQRGRHQQLVHECLARGRRHARLQVRKRLLPLRAARARVTAAAPPAQAAAATGRAPSLSGPAGVNHDGRVAARLCSASAGTAPDSGQFTAQPRVDALRTTYAVRHCRPHDAGCTSRSQTPPLVSVSSARPETVPPLLMLERL